MVKTSKDLRKALKEAGLPFSYPTYLSYIKKGIIAEPKNKMEYENGYFRAVFTDEEIAKAVEAVRNHVG